MTTTTPRPVRPRTVTWKDLVVLAVAGDLALLLAQVVARQDLEALGVAAAMVLGALLLRLRGGLVGLVILCLSFANLEVWMLPAAVSNAGHREGLVGILLPGALAAVSLAGLVASLAAIAFRRRAAAGGRAVRGAGLGAVAAVAAALVVAAAVGPGPVPAPRGDELAVELGQTAYRPMNLTAPSGRVTLHLVNRDLFWHSFTIDDPAVNADVPVGGGRRVTLDLPPGTYQFYCRVPGHKQAGMIGTLSIR